MCFTHFARFAAIDGIWRLLKTPDPPVLFSSPGYRGTVLVLYFPHTRQEDLVPRGGVDCNASHRICSLRLTRAFFRAPNSILQMRFLDSVFPHSLSSHSSQQVSAYQLH